MEVVVGIPIVLDSHDAFRDQVLSVARDRFLFAGQILMSLENSAAVRCEIHEADPNMALAFELGGQGTISENDLAAIAAHRSVVYLITDRTGLTELHQLHTFIDVTLECGGLGVKFENSGVAHGLSSWQQQKFCGNNLDLLQSHVMLAGDEQFFYSTGMHIFGLPDATVPATIENQAAAQLLTEFNHYRIFEAAQIKDGQTFSLAADAPHFRLHLKEDEINAGQECFVNPYGRFLLEPL
ncbi:DUF4261 domain-containing protein [Gimesia algae]|uniref:DUF4261 domain-containing protein n=1 Tax=Gimesia algae TaxID=2527971 RepID=UPI0011A8470C|nr:DUF4261 domain-containing protein [Gimesia algae]